MAEGIRVGRLYSELGLEGQDKVVAEAKAFYKQLGKALKLDDTGIIDFGSAFEKALGKAGNAAKKLKNETDPLKVSWKNLQYEAKGLRNEFQATGLNAEQITARLKEIRDEALRLRPALEQDAKAFAQFGAVAGYAQRTIDGIEGRMSRLGLASQVSLAFTNQLTNGFYRMGPAGFAAAAGLNQMAAGAAAGATSIGALTVALAPYLAILGVLVGLGKVAFAASKEIISLEQAQAEVIKTTNLSAQGIEQLTRNLQAQSVTTGTSTEQLLTYASVAGQLGVRGVANLTQFTNTLDRLAIATDVVGEEGANRLARFLIATNTATETFGQTAERTGNALNLLENNLAATAGETLQAARYTQQIVTQFGASREAALAYAAAIVSVGQEAEGAGSGVVRTFRDIEAATRNGGKSLEGFAAVAGQSADAYRKLFAENSGEAVTRFVEGLAKAKDEGKNLNAILEGLGITELRQVRATVALAGGADKLRLALSLVNDEAALQNSLNLEVERRLNTVSGQWKIFRARIAVAAQVLGETLLPYLRGMVDFLNNNTEAIGYIVAGFDVFINAVGGAARTVTGFVQLSIVGFKAAYQAIKAYLDYFFDSAQAMKLYLEGLNAIALKEYGRAEVLIAGSLKLADTVKQKYQDSLDGIITVDLYQETLTAVTNISALFDPNGGLQQSIASFSETAAAATGRLQDLNAAADENIKNAYKNELANELFGDSLDNLGDSTGKTTEKLRTQQDVLDDLNKRLEDAPKLATALGKDFDETKFKADALSSAITELITDFNVDPNDATILDLMSQLRDVSADTAEEIAKARRELQELTTDNYVKKLGFQAQTGQRRTIDIIAELDFQKKKLEQQLAAASQAGNLADTISIQNRLTAVTGLLNDLNKPLQQIQENLKKTQEAATTAAQNEDLFPKTLTGDQNRGLKRRLERQVAELQTQIIEDYANNLKYKDNIKGAPFAAQIGAGILQPFALGSRAQEAMSNAAAIAARSITTKAGEKTVEAFQTWFIDTLVPNIQGFGNNLKKAADATHEYEKQLNASRKQSAEALNKFYSDILTQRYGTDKLQTAATKSGLLQGLPNYGIGLGQNAIRALLLDQGISKALIDQLFPEVAELNRRQIAAYKEYYDSLSKAQELQDRINQENEEGAKTLQKYYRDIASNRYSSSDQQNAATKAALLKGLPNGGLGLTTFEIRVALKAQGVPESLIKLLFGGDNQGLTDTSFKLREVAASFTGVAQAVALGIADVIDGITRISEAGNDTDKVISGITQALEGLGRIGDSLSGSDVYDIVAGVASVAGEVAGMIAGIPGLGKLVSAAFTALKPVLGNLSNGIAQINQQIEELDKRFNNLSKTTIDALKVTKEVARGGIAGIFDPFITQLDEEATNAALDLASSIANAFAGALSGNDLGAALNRILMDELIKSFILTPETQAKIEALTKLIREIVADGVITEDEAQRFKEAYGAIDKYLKEKQKELDKLDTGGNDNTPGRGGISVTEITGATRDLFLELFSPLSVLPEQTIILSQSRDYLADIRNAIMQGQFNRPTSFSSGAIGAGNPITMNIYQQPGQSTDALVRQINDQLRFYRG